jgi:hypothetical protein
VALVAPADRVATRRWAAAAVRNTRHAAYFS